MVGLLRRHQLTTISCIFEPPIKTSQFTMGKDFRTTDQPRRPFRPFTTCENKLKRDKLHVCEASERVSQSDVAP